MLEGTRGGNTRAFILKRLIDKPHNANQLAKALDMDYKTTRHHLDILKRNGIIAIRGKRYGKIYFISKDMETKLKDLEKIREKLVLLESIHDG